LVKGAKKKAWLEKKEDNNNAYAKTEIENKARLDSIQ